MMYGSRPLCVNATTMSTFSLSKCTGSPERRIFLTGILTNIRSGATEYLRSMEQVNEVKMRLRANESLTVKFEDDVYYIRLAKKGKTA